MLIKAGAVVDHEDTLGKTALAYAFEYGYRGCAFTLLRAGATIPVRYPAHDPAHDSTDLYATIKAIKKCGGWQRHVELHRGRALRIISACVGDALPEDVTPRVLGFWVSPGGY